MADNDSNKRQRRRRGSADRPDVAVDFLPSPSNDAFYCVAQDYDTGRDLLERRRYLPTTSLATVLEAVTADSFLGRT